MNIADFNIGIEIEYRNGKTEAVCDNMILKGVNTQLVPYNRCHATHSGWIVTTDQTVSRNICYQTGKADGGEVVSPKLKFHAAMDQIDAVCDALNEVDEVAIDSNCGLHISISWPNMTTQQVRNLLARYKRYERDIDAFMPPSRRGDRNRWCGSLDAYWVNRVINGRGDRLSALREGGKFVKVNLMNLGAGDRSRIEFRHHSGTTNAQKIKSWIEFLCHMIISANKQTDLKARFRASKPAFFADIREQLAGMGITTKWSRTHAVNGENGLSFHDQNGRQIDVRTSVELRAFYINDNIKGRNGALNDHGMQELRQIIARCGVQAQVDNGLYNGLPVETREYFEQRVASFT